MNTLIAHGRVGFMRSFHFIWLVVSSLAFVDSFSVSPTILQRHRVIKTPASITTSRLCMTNDKEHDNLELAWRHAKKPLLRIGSKGATLTHGNSLRQLLEAHTVVKVKINTRKYGSLQDAFGVVRDLCQEAGAPEGIELVQAREGDKVILFGLPGTMKKIQAGDFPPVVSEEEEDGDTSEE